MKTKLIQTGRIAVVCLLALILGLMPTLSRADNTGQNLTIQNVTLQPGDVINLRGGFASYVNPGDTGGHAAMYLGLVDERQKFLDFTTTKKAEGENAIFRGRILDVEEFLNASAKSHDDFDVYRIKDAEVIQEKLAAAAKHIAEKQNWVIPSADSFSTTYAGAVAQALSAATNKKIGFTYRPDALTDENGLFKRTSPITVNLRTALNERLGVQISGTWRGTYSYDDRERAGETGDFAMMVNQQGSAISGTITDNEAGSATFSGTFDPKTMQINFTKTYGSGGHDQIDYRGVVDSSGNTAAGRWYIGSYGGSWSIYR